MNVEKGDIFEHKSEDIRLKVKEIRVNEFGVVAECLILSSENPVFTVGQTATLRKTTITYYFEKKRLNNNIRRA